MNGFEAEKVREQRPGRWTAWDGDVIIGVSDDRIERAVEMADIAAGKAPRSTGRKFVVTNSIGFTAYTTTANGPELPAPTPDDTRSEAKVAGLIERAGLALDSRDYEKAHKLLTDAAFGVYALRLLGPYGVDAIPVDAAASEPIVRDPIDDVEAYRG